MSVLLDVRIPRTAEGRTMVVCHCKAVSDRTVDAAIASGATSVPEITARCTAGGGCGGCHRLLEALLEATVMEREPASASAA
jgi:bacterioferritin-associated ferredoxin